MEAYGPCLQLDRNNSETCVEMHFLFSKIRWGMSCGASHRPVVQPIGVWCCLQGLRVPAWSPAATPEEHRPPQDPLHHISGSTQIDRKSLGATSSTGYICMIKYMKPLAYQFWITEIKYYQISNVPKELFRNTDLLVHNCDKFICTVIPLFVVSIHNYKSYIL